MSPKNTLEVGKSPAPLRFTVTFLSVLLPMLKTLAGRDIVSPAVTSFGRDTGSQLIFAGWVTWTRNVRVLVYTPP